MKEKFIVLAFLTIFSLITTPIIKNKSLLKPINNGFNTYQVQKGDSLWGIAIKYDSDDIENFLIDTKKLNNLKDSIIFEDQILLIP